MRIAIPVIQDDQLSRHFGHADTFMLFDVVENDVVGRERVTPPPHAPGVLPAWLKEQGADVIIAGGMGGRALELFAEQGIRVVVGAEPDAVEAIVRRFLDDRLAVGANVCDH